MNVPDVTINVIGEQLFPIFIDRNDYNHNECHVAQETSLPLYSKTTCIK